MSSKLFHRITSTILALTALNVAVAPAAFAEEYFDAGVKLFNKKQFNQARPYFDKAVENAPWDSNAFYYQALTAQYCKDWKAAKDMWAKIIERFPGTPAATNATAVMKSLDPGYFKRAKAQDNGFNSPNASTSTSTGATASAGASAKAGSKEDEAEAAINAVEFNAPAQARVPITRSDNHVLVDVSVNNRTVKMDFNGSTTCLTPKDATTLGVTNPDRTPVKVGKRAPVSMRLGDISTRNFPILVEDGERSRLGDDFFRKFTYQLDPTVLVVTKKLGGGGGGGRTAYDVPFKRQGKDMVIDVTVNGRRVSMIFDQEGGQCIVPRKRAREFGLDVQEQSEMVGYGVGTDREKGPMRGEAGFGEVKTNTVAEAKVNVGPVSGQVVTFTVDENAKDAKIGSSAFGSWKYSVDQGAGLIRFNR